MVFRADAVSLPRKGRLRRFELTDGWVVLGLPAAEMALTLCAALASGSAYHWVFYEGGLPLRHCAVVGLLVGLLFTLPFAVKGEYGIVPLLQGRRSPRRLAMAWTYAFLSLGVIAFLTKTASIYSRGWAITFYVCGLLTILAFNLLAVEALRHAKTVGRVARRRVALVGIEPELRRAEERLRQDGSTGVDVVSMVPLHDGDAAGEAQPFDADRLHMVVDRLRAAHAQDIVVAVPWSEARLIETLVDELSELPVAIHLAGARLLDRFDAPRSAHIGSMTALTLTREPLSLLERTTKRAFDIVVASLALTALAPLFGVVAVLIVLDSPGGVIFWQRRRGFNHQEFRIAKFRTMTTADDGDHVPQAQRGDRRITRVGTILRRWSIDELPQLWNVLRGEMSIVGPRPHAVAHDRHFQDRIEGYPRRLNVKPGITGWAQVHGLRGETDTDEKMRARVEHDLYYIDNWSLTLDLAIILRTLFSRRCHANAL